ncbi:MAG: type IV secretory system conjugative DNA transfer family protein [Bdellovibrionales bacterium]
MSDNKKSKNDSDVYYLFVLACLFVFFKLISNLEPVAISFYQKYWILIALVTAILTGFLVNKAWTVIAKKREDKVFNDQITNGEGEEDSVFAGVDKNRKKIFIPLSSRTMHTQVIGTTNAGKTESVIIPWAVDDISKERGLLLLDGKSDESLLKKIYSYVVKYRRQEKFKYFSLTNIGKSHTFNPLLGGTTEEISERVFGAFLFENEYYRGVQYEIFSQAMRIFSNAKEVPTFLKLHQAISNPLYFRPLVDRCKDPALILWGNTFMATKPEERDKRTSGLLSQIASFAFGDTAALFNVETPSIDLENALKNNEAVYFQLPVLKFPTLGKATGKLVLQVLQSAVSSRHQNGSEDHKFFSCYLDDFSEFLPKSFVSLLNKSRSANVGITFAHQALGDLKALGPDVENTILVNSNLKVFMRTNEPDSAEYFAKVAGTTEIEKTTERQTKSMGMNQKTGEASVRLAEEFIHHPNEFKKKMGVGEALIIIPHSKGTKTVRMKFSILPDLKAETLPSIPKEMARSLMMIPQDKNESTNHINAIDHNKKEVA